MRRTVLIPSAVSIVALSAAYAATVPAALDTAPKSSDNTQNDAAGISLLSVGETSADGEWFRTMYTQGDFDAYETDLEANKTASGWTANACDITAPTGRVTGNSFSLFVGAAPLTTFDAGSLTLPATTHVTTIEMLTLGADLATGMTSDYTITVNVSGGANIEFTIPIESAADTAASVSGSATTGTGTYTVEAQGFTAGSCDDNGSLITLDIGGVDVTSVDFGFNAAELGGIVAFSSDSDSTMDSTRDEFEWDGQFVSSQLAEDAVQVGGDDAEWTDATWTTTANDGDVRMRVRCATPAAATGEIPDGDWTAWSSPIAITSSGTAPLPAGCDGTHLQYELAFFSDIVLSPDVTAISFEANQDFDGDGVFEDADCDDTDPDVFPGQTLTAAMVNNGVDDNCSESAVDPTIGDECFQSVDGDAFGNDTVIDSADNDCTDTGESINDTDCKDDDPQVFPGRALDDPGQVNNGIDDNCSEGGDEDDGDECFQDLDGDTFGTAAIIDSSNLSCGQTGESITSNDCLDTGTDADEVFPGRALDDPNQVDNGIDDDCSESTVDATIGDECFQNQDGDAFGTDTIINSVNQSCAQSGEADQAGDCRDTGTRASEVFPGRALDDPDQVNNGYDDNCNEADGVGDECFQDNDGDSFGTATIIESGNASCAQTGEAIATDDCMDSGANAAQVFPGRALDDPGQVANGIDDDCSESATDPNIGDECFQNQDGDAFGTDTIINSPNQSCAQGGESVQSGDCRDTGSRAAQVFPGRALNDAAQVNNGYDDDCSEADGSGDECFQDQDGDSFGTTTIIDSTNVSCAQGGEAINSNDCLDVGANADQVFLGRALDDPSQVNNGIDDDCSQSTTDATIGDECFQNQDGDAFGTDTIINSANQSCAQGGESVQSGDCRDTGSRAAEVFPGRALNDAAQVDNGYDDNCSEADGSGDECFRDQDGDDFGTTTIIDSADVSCAQGGEAIVSTDCLDSGANAAQVFPGRALNNPSQVANGIDDDCSESTSNPNIGDECFRNQDGDAFGTSSIINSTNQICADAGESDQDGDCYDTDSVSGAAPANTVFPGAAIEARDVDDTVDGDCQNGDECYLDNDGDGFGVNMFVDDNGAPRCLAADNESARNDDCADSNSNAFPGKAFAPSDVNNNVDNNCSDNGAGDECYQNQDNDDFGTSVIIDSPNQSCGNAGESHQDGDCRDTGNNAAEVYPGRVINLQSQIDNDIDDNCTEADGVGDECWNDQDNDDFGNDEGMVRESTDRDCNDNRESSNAQDCRDDVATIYPGRVQELLDDEEFATLEPLIANNVDDDCDNNERDECWVDGDTDGFGTDLRLFVQESGDADSTCETGDMEATVLGDCDDGSPDFNVGINDTCSGIYGGDGIANNCDGRTLFDDDGDGVRYADEVIAGTDDCDTDSDNDGLDDRFEIDYVCGGGFELDPTSDDTDGDGVPDEDEIIRDRDLVDGLGIAGIDPEDVDGDGVKNACDSDDDGDGINTIDELQFGNTDITYDNGDGLPDYLDADDDGDGIPSSQESIVDNMDGDTDPDGRPLVDYRDDDDDGDGLLTAYELSFTGGVPDDQDGDGEDNHLDTDSDHAGAGGLYSDAYEDALPDSGGLPADWNNNGEPNFLDDDNDGDTVPDEAERGPGADFDGTEEENVIDIDDDGDGIDTIDEQPRGGEVSDFNNNGDPNWFDLDSDGDTIDDEVEGEEDCNLDGDNRRNFLDEDSDGDTVGDRFERRSNTDSSDGPDYCDIDDDGDGQDTATEVDPAAPGSNPRAFNFDGTDEPNYLDTDDDNDGIPTLNEAASTAQESDNADGDSNPAFPNWIDTDSDNDGVSDMVEGDNECGLDNDGLRDFLDTDSDNDTVLDGDELRTDSGGAPGPDYCDDDDDGDTIPTRLEYTRVGDDVATSNADGNGPPNYLNLDSDGDGYSDQHEWETTLGGERNSDLGGTNADDLRDFVDPDSDGDGIPDIDELMMTYAGASSENRINDDDDGDGVPTLVEGTRDTDGNADDTGCDSPVIQAAFGDSCPDYLDVDDDDDSILTIEEISCSGPTGVGGPVGDDQDGDGTDNYLDTDDDDDGLTTLFEETLANADGDACRNAYDLDSDQDGFPDCHEAPAGNAVDSGGLNLPDFVDLDSDGDSVSDADELGGGLFNDQLAGCVPSTATLDTDNNGTEDRLDTDDDGDFVDTALERYTCAEGDTGTDLSPLSGFSAGLSCIEGTAGASAVRFDFDGDGTPNYLDLDDDGDTIPNALEDYIYDDVVAPLGVVLDPTVEELPIPVLQVQGQGLQAGDDDPTNNDIDGDGAPDYLDYDDDDDGLATRFEIEGVTISLGGLQANNGNFGVPDAAGWADRRVWNHPRQDGHADMLPDHLDPDDDGDEIPTRDELGDGATFRNTNAEGFANNCFDLSPTDTLAIHIGCFDTQPDYLDIDDDGDGVPTWAEMLVPNGQPHNSDADGDGVLDGREWINFLNLDAPAGPSVTQEAYLGIDQILLASTDDLTSSFLAPAFFVPGNPTEARCGEVLPVGLPTDDYPLNTGLGRTWLDPWDRDCDLQLNFFDTDDDNDGRPTRSDGEIDVDEECDPVIGTAIGDGIPNFLDVDSDGEAQTFLLNDGNCSESTPPGMNANAQCTFARDFNEGLGDADGDSLDDFRDCDDSGENGDFDGDNLSNGLERALCAENREELIAIWEADFACLSSAPGWDSGDNTISPPRPPETATQYWENRGLDYCQAKPDVDCDGVLDCDEFNVDPTTGASGRCDVSNSSRIGYDESDQVIGTLDGTIVQNDLGLAGVSTLGSLPAQFDLDGDEALNMFDTDDDGDGVLTADEQNFSNADLPFLEDYCLNANVRPSDLRLTVENGRFVGWFPICNTGNPDTDFCPTIPGTPADACLSNLYRNTDGTGVQTLENDAVFDHMDLNDDGDANSTSIEQFSAIEVLDDQGMFLRFVNCLDDGEDPNDRDCDGLPNYLDPADFDGDLADPDGDGISTRDERDLGTDPYNADTDGDGLNDNQDTNPLNPDEDGDGICTSFESLIDTDGDGTPNFLDDDSDGDGVPDNMEVEGDCSCGSDTCDIELLDSDCDNIPDILDGTVDENLCTGVLPTDVPSGCGCSASSSSGASGFGLFGLLSMALLRRRRR